MELDERRRFGVVIGSVLLSALPRMPGFTLASYIDIVIVCSGGIHLECRHYE